jgi:F-type H+-transporting ATPase subunit gamma
MSRRRELGRRLNALTDISGILSAMRGLALMETRILGEFLESQRCMVSGIETAAADFLAWHPEYLPPEGHRRELWVLVGSEQGFCGDFNETIEARVLERCGDPGTLERWVLVGRRLADRLGDHPRTVRSLPGATVANEVPDILLRLTRELIDLLTTEGLERTGLSTLYHDEATGALRLRHLLPLRDLPSPRIFPFGPELNLPPAQFVREAASHYLYAALSDVLYTALMAENRRRYAHMDRAIDRLDEQIAGLKLAYNRQRQEEITEEIEVILLSARMLASELE